MLPLFLASLGAQTAPQDLDSLVRPADPPEANLPLDPAKLSASGIRPVTDKSTLEKLFARTGDRTAPTAVPFGPGCTIPTCTGTDEQEPCGTDSNNGCVADFCDDAAFVDATAGGTWCGTAWADAGLRDLDYYSIDVGNISTISVTLNSAFPSELYLVESVGGAANCDGLLVTDLVNGGSCSPISINRTVVAGTYYVVIATGDAAGPIFDGIPCGASPGQNDYQVDISINSADCLTCTGTPEADACGADTNAGCNAATPPGPAASDYEVVAAPDTICGTIRTFIDPTTGGQLRDLDWFDISALVTNPTTDLSIELNSEFPGTVLIVRDDGGLADCMNLVLVAETLSAGCVPSTEVVTLSQGNTYYAIVTSADQFGPLFTGIGDCTDPANEYSVTFSTAASSCPPDCALVPSGTVDEMEACGTSVNPACSSPTAPPAGPYSLINLGDTVTGTTWADSGTRDVDWYRFTATQPGTITYTVESEVPVLVQLFTDEPAAGILDDCTQFFAFPASEVPGDCTQQTFSFNLNPNAALGFSEYALVVTPAEAGAGIFSGYPCACDFNYNLTFSTLGQTCLFPAGLCDSDCSTGDLVFPLTAQGNTGYDDVILTFTDVDGNVVGTANSGPVAVGAQFTVTFTPPSDGAYQVDFEVLCTGGGTDMAGCVASVYTFVPGTTDLVFDGQGPDGCTDSTQALVDALQANGRTVTVVDNLFQAIDGYDCLTQADNVWVSMGTFPNNFPILAGEGIALNTGVTAGDFNVFLEGGDIWGFDAPTAFFDVDGVEGLEADGNVILDGDDSLLALDGFAGTTVDTSGLGSPVIYEQDNRNISFNGGDDFFDQLIAGPNDLPVGSNTEIIWANADPLAPYGVGVAKAGPASTDGRVICHSFEFGGFTGDKNELMNRYLTFFAGSGGGEDCSNGIDDDGDMLIDCADSDCVGSPACPGLIRGDVNTDSLINIGDAIYLLGNLFPPSGSTANVINCDDAADANDDGLINIGDAIFLLGNLFPPMGSSPNVIPPPNSCGPDTTNPLGCVTFSPCP